MTPVNDMLLDLLHQKSSFINFLDQRSAYPDEDLPDHIARLIAVLQRVADGNCPRLLILTPVGYGVTPLLSYFMAYLKDLNESAALDRFILGEKFDTRRPPIRYATHTQSDAEKIVGKACVAAPCGEQKILASTVGAFCTGLAFDAAVIASPYKNESDATEHAAKVNHWFDNELMTRMMYREHMPECPIIVADCRWRKGDLVGHILENHADENWHVVHLPAICPEELPEYLQNAASVESDWRLPGDVLHPANLNHRELDTIRKGMKPHQWQAQWMLDPA